MLRRLLFAGYERQLNRAYRNRLASRGSTAQGVFWRSQSSQFARFDALLSLVHQLRGDQPTSIADIGCGYGAMLDFISASTAFRQIDYQGVDINRAMIAACKQKFPYQTGVFSTGNKPSSMVNFCLFSGTFNLTHSHDPALWNDYIFTCLDRCMARAQYGLILNLLCAPKAKIQKQIFYASRAAFIQRAETHFGPTHAQTTRHVTGDVSFVITRKS
ncbi:class I SAM-dependent methyltransferase [Candidatus Puniceispirillum sp.]|nr:class I SAM-dependent methyltransferase [Candidatus Puniceispirillum sp.]